jgi:hypothetical protein
MRAIKMMATVDSQGQLALDNALTVERDLRVEVIILVPDDAIEVDLEDRPKAEVLNDLCESLQDLKAGRVYPIAELWDGIDV